ncbi:MAG TPA: DUF3089 domain-containing protein [Minicystis sp.]|nr:DUF3089 domain-containing protein [Minicystis sp.]
MRRSVRLALAAALALVTLAGCAPAEPAHIPAGLRSPFTGYESPRYRDSRMWLCRPDMPSDACRVDLTETEVRADGSRVVVPRAPAAHPDVDCFYVYPTVDMGVFAQNHTDFDDTARARDVARFQVAHFSEVCSVYAPLYRQASIGTYLADPDRREAFLDVAASDVEDAFLHYMAHFNRGRRVVLLGHSQGADMILRLIRKRFDDDPAMLAKLVVAMPIGGPAEVVAGRKLGGSSVSVPVCTRPDEIGCMVAYHSYRGGEAARVTRYLLPSPGRETICVNPAGPGDRRLSRAVFAVTEPLKSRFKALRDVTTPFVSFPDYYAARCMAEGRFHYLEVREAPLPGDRRSSPFSLDAIWFGTALGLHVLDYQFTQGDLVELVRRKAAAASHDGG